MWHPRLADVCCIFPSATESLNIALQDAVYAARKDAGHEGWFELDSPATPERLRMACADHLTAPFAAHDMRPMISC